MTPSNQAIIDPAKYIFIIAGEESGDIHGAKLVEAIKKLDPALEFIGHGGDKMAAIGVKIIEHISTLSVVGFTEVITRIPYIRKVMKNTISKIKITKPVRIILIDYPGFNLRLAKKIQKLKIPVTYFILPQVWAWKEKRAFKINSLTDQTLSIIPFEKDWYNSRGLTVDFVGHPFVDIEKPAITKQQFFAKHTLTTDKPLVTLLPGSRQQEINRHWPIFAEVINKLHGIFPNIQFILGKATHVTLPDCPEFVRIEKDDVHLAMKYGTAGLVASGTATLEAAVFDLPTVVCYKTSGITYWLGKQLTKVKYLSLINLIANRRIVPELIQYDMTPDTITKLLIPLLSETPEREKMMVGYKQTIAKLGKPGAYSRAAKLIVDKINA